MAVIVRAIIYRVVEELFTMKADRYRREILPFSTPPIHDEFLTLKVLKSIFCAGQSPRHVAFVVARSLIPREIRTALLFYRQM